MDESPLISVIMPVYNVEAFVADAVASVCRQSYTRWELVVVDDGSTDGSLAVVNRLAEAESRIRVIATANRGVAMARNEGIAAARGRLLAFVDSDDIAAEGYLRVMLDALVGSEADIATVAFCDDVSRLYDSTAMPTVTISDAESALAESLYQRDNNRGINASLCGKLFRRCLFDGQSCTPGTLYEDLDMVYRLLLRSRRVASADAPCYFYRQRPGSIIHSFTPQRLSVIDVCQRLCDYPQVKSSPALLRAARDRLFSASCNMLLLMWRHGLRDAAMRTVCRDNIRRYRRSSLFNRHTRLKNKLGALASYILVG